MNNKEYNNAEETFTSLQKETQELKQKFIDIDNKCELLDSQIKKLEDILEKLDKKKEDIIINALSKRKLISKKIDLFGLLPIGLGTILTIILFGIITKEVGIILENICMSGISVVIIMVVKMLIEIVIDGYIIEKISKTKQYINIEELRKQVIKTLEEIKNKKNILDNSRNIEIDKYNEKIQRLYELECTLDNNREEKNNMTVLSKESTKKLKTRQRCKKNKSTGDI